MHHFVAVESQRKYLDTFESWLLNKRYITGFPNQAGMSIQPNVKEIRLLDICSFVSTTDDLLRDLAPYNTLDTLFKKRMNWVKDMGFKFAGLESAPEPRNSTLNMPKWREYVTVQVLGTKPDQWVNGVEMI